jgi:hypothetical protein
MIDQGTYRSSACPFECTRRIARHEVVESNEENMLAGLGMLGEHFFYPGHDDSNQGFSRFPGGGNSEGLLHPLHMSHNVTLDQCDDIVSRHQLLAPHGVWLVNKEYEGGFVSAERLGDCGLFLGARSSVDADIWRAFYRYARMILRLGHVDTWFDDDIVAAVVHSSSEKLCNPSTSKVCLWWSEFDLDDEEYSCRPKRDASNIVTPSILLQTLAENKVAYPPPSPPPPQPPSTPPAPSPPPGAIRCELSGVATTKGYKVPAFDPILERYVPVQKKCWRWDPGNDWPPFVAHRDLYFPRDRCSGDNSRDVQWDGGFKQSLLSKTAWDPLYQNNDDCPWKARMGRDYLNNRGRMEDGAKCSDGGDRTKTASENRYAFCTLGTNLQSCGTRKNLVVFGYGYAPRFASPDANLQSAANAGQPPEYNIWKSTPFYKAKDGYGTFRHAVCIGLPGATQVADHAGKWIWTGEDDSNWAAWVANGPQNMRPDWWLQCRDGGPGSVGEPLCYYGTDSNCGKRRFAFEFDESGPDIPDDSCAAVDENGAPRANNGVCEDGLMWSVFAPGNNPCAPNTDLSDCGWRPAKRYARVGATLSSETCEVPNVVVNPTTQAPHSAAMVALGAVGNWTSDPDVGMQMPCSDYSDDIFHGNDLRLRTHETSQNAGTPDAVDEQCGRGTQTTTCQRLAEAELNHRFGMAAHGIDNYDIRFNRDAQVSLTHESTYPYSNGGFNSPDNPYPNIFYPDVGSTYDGMEGTLAYASYKYQEKAVYINPNLVDQGACVSPYNMLHNANGDLVRPRMFHGALDTASHLNGYTGAGQNWGATAPSLAQEHTVWFDESVAVSGGDRLKENMRLWPLKVCSDGGEGSVRVPFEFGVSDFDYGRAASLDTKFFYDFGCPYGSQPEACPERVSLQEYQQTMDEIEQPSGPAFSNCFDDDVPDFECCHAENQFIIHGGPGVVGNLNTEELEHCALPEAPADPGMPNTRSYPTSRLGRVPPDSQKLRLYYPDNPELEVGLNPSYIPGVSKAQCLAFCDNFGPGGWMYNGNLDAYATYDYTNDMYDATLECGSVTYSETLARCRLYALTIDELIEDGQGVFSSETLYDSVSYDLFLADPASAYEWPELLDPCPVHWTSFHHTSTGCEAFCRQAFQREGEDNTCMPAYPECANWLDSNEFPTDKYVTVNTECICGAKLEELQNPGEYVHTGTVLQGTRARARERVLHEDEGVDSSPWEWADGITQGIDQFHSAHFDVGDACIAEIMSFRLDLLNNSQCDDYLTMTSPPIDEWDRDAPNPDHPYCNTEGRSHCQSGQGESGASLTAGASVVGLYTVEECLVACAAFDGCGAFDVTSDTSQVGANDASSCRLYSSSNVPRLGVPGTHDRTYCWMPAGDDQCCVASRGEARTSRVWSQGVDMTTASVATSFGVSQIVGTAVHTSQVAAVGNFVRRFATFKPQHATNSPVHACMHTHTLYCRTTTTSQTLSSATGST